MERTEPTLGKITGFFGFGGSKPTKSAADIASNAFKAFEEAEREVAGALGLLAQKQLDHEEEIKAHQNQLTETQEQVSRLERFQQRIKEFTA